MPTCQVVTPVVPLRMRHRDKMRNSANFTLHRHLDNSLCFTFRSPWEKTIERATRLSVRASPRTSWPSSSTKPDPIAQSSASPELNAAVACMRDHEVIRRRSKQAVSHCTNHVKKLAQPKRCPPSTRKCGEILTIHSQCRAVGSRKQRAHLTTAN